MPLPTGFIGFVHGLPNWFTRLLPSGAQAPSGTQVYAMNVDPIDRGDRELGEVSINRGERNFVAFEFNANQNLRTLIPAPGPGLSIVIYDLLASTGTAGTFLLQDNINNRLFGRISFAANGGWCFNSYFGFAVTANQSLVLTSTTGAGPLAVTINYAIE